MLAAVERRAIGGPIRNDSRGVPGCQQCPSQGPFAGIGLHVVCVGSAASPFSAPSLLLLSSLSLRNLHCLFLGSVEEGWREALLSLKMFLLNILILPRHQSLYFPFSPYPILPLQQKLLAEEWKSQGRGWGVGAAGRAPERKSLGHYPQNVSCCVVVVGLEANIHLGAPDATCKQCSK